MNVAWTEPGLPTPTYIPGATSPLEAMALEREGFRAIYVGGWATGAVTGVTEPRLTMVEQADVAGAVARHTNLPVITDGGTGFGEVVHIRRTLEEMAFNGIGTVHIEDQVYPKRAHYHRGREYVVDRYTFARRLSVAISFGREVGVDIIARTDAAKAVDGSVAEAIYRCNQAEELGAVAVMPLTHDFATLLEVRAGLDVSVPTIRLGGHIAGLPDGDVIGDGHPEFDVVILPLVGVTASYVALRAYFGRMAELDKLPNKVDVSLDMESLGQAQVEIEGLIGLPELWDIESKSDDLYRGVRGDG